MSERDQITFMQTRLLRLASEEWHMQREEVNELFKKMNIFQYIQNGFGIFHCEGDEAVLEDIEELLGRKGIKINAGTV